MARRPSRKIPASRIKGFVRDLSVIDVDVSKVQDRLSRARTGGVLGDSGMCIIDITCCIIDCSGCTPGDIDIFSNPANKLDGILFRLRGDKGDLNAPVYFLPSVDARTAMRMGHGSVSIPGGKVAAKTLGLAGQFLEARALTVEKIAPTAPVIALTANKAA
jgi:hypothetical protein